MVEPTEEEPSEPRLSGDEREFCMQGTAHTKAARRDYASRVRHAEGPSEARGE